MDEPSRWRPVVLVGLTVLAGLGAVLGLSAFAADPRPPSTAGPVIAPGPAPELPCPGLRESSTIDHRADAVELRTPADQAKELRIRGEAGDGRAVGEVIYAPEPDLATAVLVDTAGAPVALLRFRFSPDSGWLLETTEECA
jgi:hypothetical protein